MNQKKIKPSEKEVREYMELHNADEVGQGANAWNMEEARYHLELDDDYYYKNKKLERK